MTNDIPSEYDELPGRDQAILDYPLDTPTDLAARSLQAGRRVRRRRRVLTVAGSLAVVAVVAVAVPALVASHRSTSLARPVGDATGGALIPVGPTAVAATAEEASAAASASAVEASASASAAQAAAEASLESAVATATPGPGTTTTIPTVGSFSAYASPGATEPASVAELPAHFLAAIGAGAERQTVVTTATGTRGRVLTPGSQALGVLSDGGATLWEPIGVGTDWQAVNVATGAVSAAPQFAGDDGFSIAPDGTVAAYAHQFLTVGSARYSSSTAPYPEWSSDSRRLVIWNNGDISVLDAATLDVVKAVSAPEGCSFFAPHFRGTQTIIVSQTCSQAGTTSIVSLDASTGKQLTAVALIAGAPPGALTGVNSMDVDSAGDVIASVGYDTPGTDGVVYTVTADGIVTRSGQTDTYQVNWLPRVPASS